MHIVWFKRDLRVQDNRALSAAAKYGPVLPLYVAEPEMWSERDMSARQWAFVAAADKARLSCTRKSRLNQTICKTAPSRFSYDDVASAAAG
ncbi:MAG: deoxyribodipyrimidine photo-lyase, partial [Pseudomonadota bacterium]